MIEQCRDCVFEKTIKPIAMLAFRCKGSKETKFIDNSFPCKDFEHKDYPKKIGI